MSKNYYQIGDTVCLINHPHKYEGIVVDITDGKTMGLPYGVQKMINHGYTDNFYYRIQYSSPGLTPPADWHREKQLTLVKVKNPLSTIKYPTSIDLEYPTYFDSVCPICNTPWHKVEHPIHGHKVIWKDCLKCNDTSENLIKKYQEGPPPLPEDDDDDFGLIPF